VSAAETTGTTEANKALMRRIVEEFWNNKRLDLAEEFFHADSTSPSAPQFNGVEGVRTIGKIMFDAFPDFHMNIDIILAEGDRVVGRFTETGTHQGEFFGVPASGKKATWTEIGIFRVVDGKVKESWYETDMMTLMQAIGAMPAASS
jgi:steroid delta-isomerase-like uncharacterized protein